MSICVLLVWFVLLMLLWGVAPDAIVVFVCVAANACFVLFYICDLNVLLLCVLFLFVVCLSLFVLIV